MYPGAKGSTGLRSGRCWSRCDDVERAPCNGLRVHGARGHAKRIRRLDGGCGAKAGAGSVERRAVLVRESEPDPSEGTLLGRNRALRVREAAGAGTIRTFVERRSSDGASDAERAPAFPRGEQAGGKNFLVATGEE